MARAVFIVPLAVCLTAASFAQAPLTAALQDLAKVEAKAKLGVTAEYSVVIPGRQESTYGRIYFKDKKIRIDEIVNIVNPAKITEPVLLIRVSDYSAGNPMGDHTSSTFSLDQEFTSPQQILDYVRDETHPSSSFTKNRQQSAFVHLLRRYGWNSGKWFSSDISSGTGASVTPIANGTILSWVAGGQVKKNLTIKKGSPTVISELTILPIDEGVGSFRGYFFVEKPNSHGVYTVESESDYSKAPEDVKRDAIRDLNLDASAKLIMSEVVTLHKENFGPIDEEIFTLTPNAESVITDYRTGDFTKMVDGVRTVVGNIHQKTPENGKSLPAVWLGVAATTLLASVGAAAFKFRRSR